MRMPRYRFIAAAAVLGCAALAGNGMLSAQAPQIGKPRPAPPGPSKMLPLPPAVIDDTLAIGGDDINARKSSSRMTVEVRVNGRGPYRFLVDSGADTSVVGLRIARELQLPVSTPVVLNSMTARHLVDRVRVDELSMGPSKIHNLHVPALAERDVGGQGMVGIDAMVDQRLMMDFEKLTIKSEDARVAPKKLPGEIVIVARRQRGQLILTQVHADGLPIEAVVDTGSEVTIGNRALRDRLFRRNRNDFWTASMSGVTGVEVDLEMARIKELRLGPVTLRDVPIAFADVPPFEVFGMSKEPALLLGTDLLGTFRRVSLDFRSRKVRFQLRRCGSTGVMLSTATNFVTRLSSDGGAACKR
jgi:predicted aspartyl protease